MAVDKRETVSNLMNKLNENSTPQSSAEFKVISPSDFFYSSSTMDDNQIDLNIVGSIDVKPVTMVKFVNKNGKLRKPMSCLIDTGASKSLAAAHISHYGKVKKARTISFSTANGSINSTKEV